MAKSPGFWFFVGDWLKDPELRFCSIFARGLLVDLLCYMFESKKCGFLCKPDGTPRSDAEIVDAIQGGDRAEKLSALKELEQSGVLSRDSHGVLYSRRLERLGNISKERSKAGSKGGSKTKAKPNQTRKQNKGVSVSDSDSDSVLKKEKGHPFFEDSEFVELLSTFQNQSQNTHNWIVGPEVTEAWLYDLHDLGLEDAKGALRYSTSAGAKKPITNGDHKRKAESRNGSHRSGSRQTFAQQREENTRTAGDAFLSKLEGMSDAG